MLDKFIVKPLRWISKTFGLLGTAWIFVLVFLMTADVVMRSLLNRPVNGIPEIIACSLPLLAFMSLPYSTQEESHVRSEILLAKYPKRVKLIMEVLANLVGAVVYSMVVIGSWKPMLTAVRVMEYEGDGSIRVPVWEIRLVIVVAGILVVLQFLMLVVRYFKLFLASGHSESEGEAMKE